MEMGSGSSHGWGFGKSHEEDEALRADETQRMWVCGLTVMVHDELKPERYRVFSLQGLHIPRVTWYNGYWPGVTSGAK